MRILAIYNADNRVIKKSIIKAFIEVKTKMYKIILINRERKK
ncbi:hypothetical protein [Serpentinicella alkaliphila]|nr:hypothetical protein [Serpentinicella alkaliphila]